ncbi:MAG: type II secretion system F family protein, partial [Candidatus Hydrothermae bacterium]|nr:type II secretion system F family protein [Candidatus Hydrothermae bacterium]
AGPLRGRGVCPPMVLHMVSIGEETGQLSEMLGKVSEFYDEEVDRAVERLTSMMEPLMIVFIGGIVMVILLSIYLPIFKMAQVVSG